MSSKNTNLSDLQWIPDDDGLIKVARRLRVSTTKRSGKIGPRRTRKLPGRMRKTYRSCEECAHLFKHRFQLSPQEVLIAALAHHRLSITEAAEAIGVTSQVLRDIMRGDRRLTREFCFQVERATTIPAQLLLRSESEQNAEWFTHHHDDIFTYTVNRTQEFTKSYIKKSTELIRHRGLKWYRKLARTGKLPKDQPPKKKRPGGYVKILPPRMQTRWNRKRQEHLRSGTKKLKPGPKTLAERRENVERWVEWSKGRAAAYAIAMACGPRAAQRWGCQAARGIVSVTAQ